MFIKIIAKVLNGVHQTKNYFKKQTEVSAVKKCYQLTITRQWSSRAINWTFGNIDAVLIWGMHSLGIYLGILKKISNSILINKSVNFTVRQKNEKTLILQFYLVVYMGLHFH